MNYRNPFEDDDKMYGVAAAPDRSSFADAFGQQITYSLENSLNSTTRSLRLLEESEQIGIATGEDLINQGEKLHKANTSLDEINRISRETQRHLTSIKSVFGGIKNYFTKDAAPSSIPAVASDPSIVSGPRASSFGDRVCVSGAIKNPGQYCSVSTHALTSNSVPSRSCQSEVLISKTKRQTMDDQIDENLDLMSSNLRRVRELGLALGDEIEEQNRLLDEITPKTIKADATLRNQDKQMRQMIGGRK